MIIMKNKLIVLRGDIVKSEITFKKKETHKNIDKFKLSEIIRINKIHKKVFCLMFFRSYTVDTYMRTSFMYVIRIKLVDFSMKKTIELVS
jgi:hypothetical protein